MSRDRLCRGSVGVCIFGKTEASQPFTTAPCVPKHTGSLYTRGRVCNENQAQDLLNHRLRISLDRYWQDASQSGCTSSRSYHLDNDRIQCPSTFHTKNGFWQLHWRKMLSCFGALSYDGKAVCGCFVVTGIFLSLGHRKYPETTLCPPPQESYPDAGSRASVSHVDAFWCLPSAPSLRQASAGQWTFPFSLIATTRGFSPAWWVHYLPHLLGDSWDLDGPRLLLQHLIL